MPVQLLFSLRVLRKKIGMLVMIEGLVSSRSLYVVSKTLLGQYLTDECE